MGAEKWVPQKKKLVWCLRMKNANLLNLGFFPKFADFTKKYKKLIFWIIWNIFGYGNFFHTTFGFSLKEFDDCEFCTRLSVVGNQREEILYSLTKHVFLFFFLFFCLPQVLCSRGKSCFHPLSRRLRAGGMNVSDHTGSFCALRQKPTLLSLFTFCFQNWSLCKTGLFICLFIFGCAVHFSNKKKEKNEGFHLFLWVFVDKKPKNRTPLKPRKQVRNRKKSVV